MTIAFAFLFLCVLVGVSVSRGTLHVIMIVSLVVIVLPKPQVHVFLLFIHAFMKAFVCLFVFADIPGSNRCCVPSLLPLWTSFCLQFCVLASVCWSDLGE